MEKFHSFIFPANLQYAYSSTSIAASRAFPEELRKTPRGVFPSPAGKTREAAIELNHIPLILLRVSIPERILSQTLLIKTYL